MSLQHILYYFFDSKNLIFKHLKSLLFPAEASGLCRCKATQKIRLGIVVGFPFICYLIVNSMKIYLDPAPMEFCHWLLCRSSRGCIYSHLHICLQENFRALTASIAVWRTERTGVWMNPALQDSLNGPLSSLGDRPQITGFVLTTSVYLFHLPSCWWYSNRCQAFITFPGVPHVSRTQSQLKLHRAMPTNTLTRCGVLTALCASGYSQDCTGLLEVHPNPGLLSCSGCSAYALYGAPNCMVFL